MSARSIGAVVVAIVGAGCGGDDGGFVDARVDGRTTIDACAAAPHAEVSGPAAYACKEPFRATIAVTSPCAALTVRSITITAEVIAGPCGPPGPGTYPPTTAAVGIGDTVEVFDFTGGTFCCGPPSCPAELLCTEQFTFAIDTTLGMITTTTVAEIDLGGCSVICE
jgi:hypothetical protein